MTPLTIRSYKAEDCDIVSALITRCLKETNAKDYTEDVIQNTVEHFSPINLHTWFNKMETFVTEIDGTIVGTGSIEGNRVNSVFVRPDYQSRGIGRTIMEYLEGVVDSRGNCSVVLRSSLTALDFYIKLGYRQVGETYRESGGQMIEMEKRLTKAM